jgi:hypothetical protein
LEASTVPDDFSVEAALLIELTQRHWSLYAIGEPGAVPVTIVAVRRWALISDVLAIRGRDLVTAYRTLNDGTDPLRATYVIGHYQGPAADAWNAVSNPPDRFAEPYPIPEYCRIPELDALPYIVKPATQDER